MVEITLLVFVITILGVLLISDIGVSRFVPDKEPPVHTTRKPPKIMSSSNIYWCDVYDKDTNGCSKFYKFHQPRHLGWLIDTGLLLDKRQRVIALFYTRDLKDYALRVVFIGELYNEFDVAIVGIEKFATMGTADKRSKPDISDSFAFDVAVLPCGSELQVSYSDAIKFYKPPHFAAAI